MYNQLTIAQQQLFDNYIERFIIYRTCKNNKKYFVKVRGIRKSLEVGTEEHIKWMTDRLQEFLTPQQHEEDN